MKKRRLGTPDVPATGPGCPGKSEFDGPGGEAGRSPDMSAVAR